MTMTSCPKLSRYSFWERPVKYFYLHFLLLDSVVLDYVEPFNCTEMGVTGTYRLSALLEYSLILSLPSWKVK